MSRLLRYALSLPLHVAAAKGMKWAGRLVGAAINLPGDWLGSTYCPRPGAVPLLPHHIHGMDMAALAQAPAISDRHLDHQFDLLGSGPVHVAYGMRAEGFDGHGYPPVAKPPEAGALARRLSPGNRKRSAEIRGLIGPQNGEGYVPIDWQIDFKSGFRWSERRPAKMIVYGHRPGADVKVPWELARMQHLPQLAIAFAMDRAGIDGFQPPEAYKNEFRNQVLDFTAANPPRFGVNWSCTMDVAIRAANWCLAFDLFRAAGGTFDDAFLAEFHAALTAHGRHIRANLEWHPTYRANHYLADISGLLFVAAYLPKTRETGSWLGFATEELIREVERQFTADGANFEASTCYHRLSAEMAAYATALVLGLTDDNASGPFPAEHAKRLERMAEFTIHATKPDGHVAQIGDNDSGRFFKLFPVVTDEETLAENHLDHRGLVAAINGLFGRDDFAAFAGRELAAESAIVRRLAKGKTLPTGATPFAARGRLVRSGTQAPEGGDETVIQLPDPGVLEGLVTAAYPGFGLFIFSSPRLFLSLRAGPIGQNGNGGHAHNDQLAMELQIDGEDWLADPGTYVYTPSPERRDAYRSVQAHAAPRSGDMEPASLGIGLFRLENRAKAECLHFDVTGFHGRHFGYGRPIHRVVEIGQGRITIRDVMEPGGGLETVTVTSGRELRFHFALTLPFSPGYGLRDGE